MGEINENHMKRCYELAISAGKKGFDTFGAVLVCFRYDWQKPSNDTRI